MNSIQSNETSHYIRIILKKKTIEDAKKLGKHRGFECLSTEYKGNKEKLLWRCLECKYKWKANYNNIWNKKSKGCPNCNNKVKLKIGDMHKAAKDRGLIFLSPKYTNSSEKHDWECAQGHRFEATPSSIIYKKISDSRTYCSECSGNKPRPLEELLKFINEKGGELLSKKVKYENGKSIIRIFAIRIFAIMIFAIRIFDTWILPLFFLAV